MINAVHSLLTAYYDCLIPGSFDVCLGSVPETQKESYVLIRAESEQDTSNRHDFVTQPVIVLEIVTLHEQEIDTSTVEVLDNEVKQLLFPTRRTTGLAPIDDVQVLNVRLTDAFYQQEFDGARYRHRKICRYLNSINQLTNHL